MKRQIKYVLIGIAAMLITSGTVMAQNQEQLKTQNQEQLKAQNQEQLKTQNPACFTSLGNYHSTP